MILEDPSTEALNRAIEAYLEQHKERRRIVVLLNDTNQEIDKLNAAIAKIHTLRARGAHITLADPISRVVPAGEIEGSGHR